ALHLAAPPLAAAELGVGLAPPLQPPAHRAHPRSRGPTGDGRRLRPLLLRASAHPPVTGVGHAANRRRALAALWRYGRAGHASARPAHPPPRRGSHAAYRAHSGRLPPPGSDSSARTEAPGEGKGDRRAPHPAIAASRLRHLSGRALAEPQERPSPPPPPPRRNPRLQVWP